MPLTIRLDVVMARRKTRLNDLAARVGVTESNLSKLKNGRVKAIRLRTLEALCRELQCQPGDLIEYEAPGADESG
ncbi:MAG: helix-turn-helix transcriptional regulator [Myxococcota bacterium]